MSVPVIDLSGGRAAAAPAVARAVEEIGFLVVAGHGVPASTMGAMREAARALFAWPAAEKAALADAAGTLNRGYTPFRSEYNGSTRTERAPADLREGFIFGPFDLPDDPYFAAPGAGFAYQDNIWPGGAGGANGTVAAFKAYYRALETLNVALLGIFADALGLPNRFFLDKFDRHASTVRVLHYPAQPEPPAAGALRCGAHTDFGSHTILRTFGANLLEYSRFFSRTLQAGNRICNSLFPGCNRNRENMNAQNHPHRRPRQSAAPAQDRIRHTRLQAPRLRRSRPAFRP